MHQLQRSWVRSQHPSAQWNLRGGRRNSVEYSTKTLSPVVGKLCIRSSHTYNVSSVLQVRRQQGGSGHFEYEDESRGMMIDYSDHQPYREGSATPVLDCDEADEVSATAKVTVLKFRRFRHFACR
jgi:hypothetical protein